MIGRGIGLRLGLALVAGLWSASALPLAASPAAAGLPVAAPPAPKRVVSMNLCTDQLALMLAAPGQMVSVGALAANMRSSAMAEEARKLTLNHGLAEEIFLMKPDLVITGTFSNRASADMLRRLGVRVETLQPAYSLADVSIRLRQVGALLGREAEAEAAATQFEADLAALAHDGPRPRAAMYSANGYSSGPESLSGQILDAAGLDNIAGELGITIGGRVALEQLVMSRPDLVVLPTTRPTNSRAEEILHHPVIDELTDAAGIAPMTDQDWVCGTPHVLNAIRGLAAARDAWAAQ